MTRAFLLWWALLGIAVLNGMIREGIVSPRCGDRVGHLESSGVLSLAIVLLAGLTVGWMDIGTAQDAWSVGVLWVVGA